jgi:hypothetical protein
MCDASASVLADADHILVANDEDNVLRLYRSADSGGPVKEFDWTAELGIAPDDEHPEADIEAGQRVGDRVYWITSHGASSKGKKRPNRRRFFATDLAAENGAVRPVPVGTPYRDLLDHLAAAPGLKKFDLTERAKAPPEDEGGLNIEGLTATPNGVLLIGFRNPVPKGHALLVPFRNPDAVLAGGSDPRFGPPILLDLGGLGVRSIDYAPAHGSYFIVAGPVGDDGASRLYRWTGAAGDEAVRVTHVDFAGLAPEAVVAPPAPHRELLILSDDGGRMTGGVACKDAPADERKFRSLWITP